MEGNKDCEAHGCVDFLHSGLPCQVIKLQVDKIGHMCGVTIFRLLKTVKKVKIGASHRGSAIKLLNRLKDRLSDEEHPVEKFWLKK